MTADPSGAFGSCPLPISAHDTVQLGHGSGGKMMGDLIQRLFVWAFDNPHLRRLDDAAVLDLPRGRIAVSTDSFVVDPLFFPGGNIGDLAVNGTVNDVCMSGARPLYLSAGFILEEGLPLDSLRMIVESMRDAARRAGVSIVAGDTKVVNRGKGDKVFINTTGIGLITHDLVLTSGGVRPGDRILVSGGVAEHGIAVLSKREGLAFETPIESDTAPLHDLVATILEAGGEAVHALRDPTRGGLAATLNEFAAASTIEIALEERAVPVKPAVSGACELLGLDPLYVACEGRLVAAVAAARSREVLAAMRGHPLGRDAAEIGEARSGRAGLVTLRTAIGGWRILDLLVGEQLPRIC